MQYICSVDTAVAVSASAGGFGIPRLSFMKRFQAFWRFQLYFGNVLIRVQGKNFGKSYTLVVQFTPKIQKM